MKSHLDENERCKRLVDILASVTILVLASPFFVLALLALKLEHILRGDASAQLFYSETRFSKGQPFKLYKFNIFKHDVIVKDKNNGVFIHTKGYEKNGGVTKIGWLLKQIYMDELPQFFNILTGDMSLVGPRPVNQEVFENLMSKGITSKSRVKAGLTGHFQSHKDVRRLKANDLDQEYVEYLISKPWYKVLPFDLKIMARTILLILKAQGI